MLGVSKVLPTGINSKYKQSASLVQERSMSEVLMCHPQVRVHCDCCELVWNIQMGFSLEGRSTQRRTNTISIEFSNRAR